MFRYQPNRDYFFIPKPSGLPLGVHYNSTKNGGAAHLLFQIVPGPAAPVPE